MATVDTGAFFDPMYQFEIVRILPLTIGGLDVSFTNASLYMVAIVALVSLFMIQSMRGRALVPGRLQSLAELSYEFIANMVRDNAGSEGMRFFPFIFSLFMFILFANMIGMIPYSYTVTSHIIITFALAITVFLGVTAVGFVKHGLGFLKLFAPSGVPVILLPLIIVIELISYLVRPITLSVRLFANMTAGLVIMKVFAGFVLLLGVGGVLGMVGALVPLLFMVAFTALKVLVAFLQAYVFAILTCIYLNDALHMHH